MKSGCVKHTSSSSSGSNLLRRLGTNEVLHNHCRIVNFSTGGAKEEKKEGKGGEEEEST